MILCCRRACSFCWGGFCGRSLLVKIDGIDVSEENPWRLTEAHELCQVLLVAFGEDWEALCIAQECGMREHKASYGLRVPARLECLLRKLARNLQGCQDVCVSAVSDLTWNVTVGLVPSSSKFALVSRKHFLEEVILIRQ